MPSSLHPRSPLARLFAAPGRFDFFQAVRLLDRRRAEGKPGDDPVTTAAFAIAGFGTSGLRDRLGLPDDAAVFYAGFLSRQPRTATGLEQILGEYFGWPVAVEQLCGQWLYLD